MRHPYGTEEPPTTGYGPMHNPMTAPATMMNGHGAIASLCRQPLGRRGNGPCNDDAQTARWTGVWCVGSLQRQPLSLWPAPPRSRRQQAAKHRGWRRKLPRREPLLVLPSSLGGRCGGEVEGGADAVLDEGAGQAAGDRVGGRQAGDAVDFPGDQHRPVVQEPLLPLLDDAEAGVFQRAAAGGGQLERLAAGDGQAPGPAPPRTGQPRAPGIWLRPNSLRSRRRDRLWLVVQAMTRAEVDRPSRCPTADSIQRVRRLSP